MADSSRQPEGHNERFFDELNNDIEMGESTETPPPAKMPRHDFSETASAEGAGFDSNISFDDFIELVDNPDTRAILGMSPSGETTHLTNQYVPAQEMPAIEIDEPFGQAWFEQFAQLQQEHDNLQLFAGMPPLDLFGQADPPSVADDGAADWPQTGELSDAIVPEDHAPLASAEGVADPEPDLMDTDEVAGLPKLPGSPLSDYNPTTTETLQLSEDTNKQQTRALDRTPVPNGTDIHGHILTEEPKKKKNRVKDIVGFPPSEDPLPSSLTLEQHVWYYPNHLNGENLRPFVEASWTGSKIWSCMQEAARETSSKDQGSNKITKRLIIQRKRMDAEDAELTRNALLGLATRETLIGDNSGHVAHQSAEGKIEESEPIHAMNTSMTGLTPASETTHYPPPSSEHAESGRNAAKGPLNGFSRALQAEVQEQADTISQILSMQNEDWVLRSIQAQSSHVNDVWMAKAHNHEAQFVRETSVKTVDIPFHHTSQSGMLARLRELVKRALLVSNPRRDDMQPEELEAFQEQHRLLVLENELFILEGWTKSWRQQLEQIATGLVWDPAEEASLPTVGDQAQHDQLSGERLPSLEQEANLSRYVQVWAPQTFPLQFQTEAAVNSYSSVAGTVGTTQQRRRRDRLRMFPNAPATDVTLTEQDLEDRDNVLENFPEHLSLHPVMERFLRPRGLQTGEYPTTAMIARLRNHHNAKHGSDLNALGRDESLRSWLTSQKNSAKRARRNLGLRKLKRKSAKSLASNDGEDLGHETRNEHDQSDAGHVDAEAVYPAQNHHTFTHYTWPRDRPNKEQMSTIPQAGTELAAPVLGHVSPPSDDFAALLDPRLFQ